MTLCVPYRLVPTVYGRLVSDSAVGDRHEREGKIKRFRISDSAGCTNPVVRKLVKG